jgi:hypothetical protein
MKIKQINLGARKTKHEKENESDFQTGTNHCRIGQEASQQKQVITSAVTG